MCEKPNAILQHFEGVYSINGGEYKQATDKNFAMRGSILRNTNFVIGVVLYVGTETKAH